MVLQRSCPIPIWGSAPPGAAVEVRFAGARATCAAGSDGRWSVELPAQAACAEPQQLTAATRIGGRVRTATARDLLIGDVWLCSGQSNMRWRVDQSAEAADVLAHADVPGLRLLDLEGTLYPSAKRYELDFLRQVRPDNYYRTNGWRRANAASAAPAGAGNASVRTSRRGSKHQKVTSPTTRSSRASCSTRASLPGATRRSAA
jgi:sialate O-acetylesterase